MNSQEMQVLQDFLNQLTQVRGIVKDAQADALIAAAVARQPDAAYLLVQRALLMEQALNSSKAEIAALQSQLQGQQSAAAPARGFLDSNAWGNAPAASARPAAAAAATPGYPPAYPPGYPSAPAPQQAAPQYQPPPPPSPGFFSGGLGSTLGTVAATAAGVAGGAFLFQGIEHLMNGNNGGGLAHQNGLSAPVETIENTTVNNYYGGDGGKEHDRSSGDSGSAGASSNDFAELSNIDLADGSDGSDGGYDDSTA